jgi:hypothetical protein
MDNENLVDEDFAEHDAKVKIITEAVAGLWPKFGPRGMQPEAIFEGAVRGAAVVALSLGATAIDVAELLEDMAAGFRDLKPPRLRLVKGGAPDAGPKR